MYLTAWFHHTVEVWAITNGISHRFVAQLVLTGIYLTTSGDITSVILADVSRNVNFTRSSVVALRSCRYWLMVRHQIVLVPSATPGCNPSWFVGAEVMLIFVFSNLTKPLQHTFYTQLVLYATHLSGANDIAIKPSLIIGA